MLFMLLTVMGSNIQSSNVRLIVCTLLSLYLATRCHAVDLAERDLPVALGDLCYMIYHKCLQAQLFRNIYADRP